MKLVLALPLAMLLAACDGRVSEPPPLVGPTAPDTRGMGAGRFGPNCGIAALPQEVLRQVNAARALGRRCGQRVMAPVPPLRWDPALQSAAAAHSADMAVRNYFDHRSPEGGSVRQRVAAQHYAWKAVGENIAGGDTSVAAVVRGWLASPAHCRNIMEPHYADVAVACVQQPGSEWGTYWTMVLASRR